MCGCTAVLTEFVSRRCDNGGSAAVARVLSPDNASFRCRGIFPDFSRTNYYRCRDICPNFFRKSCRTNWNSVSSGRSRAWSAWIAVKRRWIFAGSWTPVRICYYYTAGVRSSFLATLEEKPRFCRRTPVAVDAPRRWAYWSTGVCKKLRGWPADWVFRKWDRRLVCNSYWVWSLRKFYSDRVTTTTTHWRKSELKPPRVRSLARLFPSFSFPRKYCRWPLLWYSCLVAVFAEYCRSISTPKVFPKRTINSLDHIRSHNNCILKYVTHFFHASS